MISLSQVLNYFILPTLWNNILFAQDRYIKNVINWTWPAVVTQMQRLIEYFKYLESQWTFPSRSRRRTPTATCPPERCLCQLYMRSGSSWELALFFVALFSVVRCFVISRPRRFHIAWNYRSVSVIALGCLILNFLHFLNICITIIYLLSKVYELKI